MAEPNEEKVEPLPLPDTPAAEKETPSRGFFRVVLLGPRAWKRWWNALVRSVSHEEILERTRDDAAFSFNYAFMVAIASGIATIGLLLNSPAVIIGAMLISPLMGPIVASGFAIVGFDVELGKRSARTLLLGALAAVAFAAAIALLSPVKELTPEILARTRPNLFDLAVAILSGAAGGYGMIRGRGGAIVGVAIATALMPPLAVVGYGLATLQWLVVRGALLLFVTNMVAIALAVAVIAEWYGFGRGALRKRFARQALIALLVLAPLAVPLSLSLKSIAWESQVQSTVRSVLETGAHALKHGQVAQVSVHFRHNEPPLVEAIIVSDESRAGLDTELSEKMKAELGAPVNLYLTQLHASEPEKLAAALAEVQTKVRAASEEHGMAAALRSEVPFPLTAVEIDLERRSATLAPQAQAEVGLGAWRTMEASLAARHQDWHIDLVPPATALPGIDFIADSAALDQAAQDRLDIIAWALSRWGLREVDLVGHADAATTKARRLAAKRLAAVTDWLAAHDIAVRSHNGAAAPTKSALKRVPDTVLPPAVEIMLPGGSQTAAYNSAIH